MCVCVCVCVCVCTAPPSKQPRQGRTALHACRDDTTLRCVDLYLVGENMFYDKEKWKAVPGGLPPAASVPVDGAHMLRDVVARASKVLQQPVREVVAHTHIYM
jgi:hypothetical protein